MRCAPKPNLRDASCCNVEVVKGAAGLRLRCFLLTLVTNNLPSAALVKIATASADPVSLLIVNCDNFLPCK